MDMAEDMVRKSFGFLTMAPPSDELIGITEAASNSFGFHQS